MTWREILPHWGAIVCDLSERHGIDEEEPSWWETRSWPWLRRRLLGLLSVDSRLAGVLARP